MSVISELRQIAGEIAYNVQGRIADLQRELEQVKTRQAEIEAQLNSARLGYQRLFNYQPALGTDLQCPSCWIEHEKRSALSSIGGGTDTEDFVRCDICGKEFSLAI